MRDHELTFGQCPLSPTGDDCHENCELFNMAEARCLFRSMDFNLRRLADSLAEIVGIFRSQAES